MAVTTCPNCNREFTPGDKVCLYCGHVFPFSTDLLTDHTLLHNRYRIERLLHSRGNGYIYLATDNKLQRQVAVKQVKERLRSDGHVEKLKYQSLSLAKLSHPGLAMVTDHFVEEAYYYVIMEYIKGKTIEEIYARHDGKLSEREVITWALKISEIIGYIHSKGMVYRDISPDNIMLDDNDHIKIVDFGTLRGIHGDGIKGLEREGKLGYTPQEQWQGKPVVQSDIFALGATMYYLLTGFLPISKEGLHGGKGQPGDYRPEFPPVRQKRSDITEGLEQVLGKALQPEVSDRYSTIREFATALQHVQKQNAEHYRSLTDNQKSRTVKQEKVVPTEPVLLVKSVSLDFGDVVTGTTKIRVLQLINEGGGTLKGTISSDVYWALLEPVSFESTKRKNNIKITACARDYPYRRYEGKVTIITNGGQAEVNITMNVTPAPVKQENSTSDGAMGCVWWIIAAVVWFLIRAACEAHH